jgi:hypothetical protein
MTGEGNGWVNVPSDNSRTRQYPLTDCPSLHRHSQVQLSYPFKAFQRDSCYSIGLLKHSDNQWLRLTWEILYYTSCLLDSVQMTLLLVKWIGWKHPMPTSSRSMYLVTTYYIPISRFYIFYDNAVKFCIV